MTSPDPKAPREALPRWGEPWFKAWLVLLPLVLWLSHAFMVNQWRRTWDILHPDDSNALPPAELWWYAGAVGIGFSLVYLGVARMYHQPSDF
jgi:hypothetical protein